ncbi:MAG: response regulator [Alphaproteobacteria bacterium]
MKERSASATGFSPLSIRAPKKHDLAKNLVWVKDGVEAPDFLFAAGAHADRAIGRKRKVVLLDLRLPKVDGLEVLQKIKADNRTESIAVTVPTSSKEDRDVSESYKLGVNSLIGKPVEFDAYAETVAQLGLHWLLVNRPPR